MSEWKGQLLPASRGERPIIDGGRTPVAYTLVVALRVGTIVEQSLMHDEANNHTHISSKQIIMEERKKSEDRRFGPF